MVQGVKWSDYWCLVATVGVETSGRNSWAFCRKWHFIHFMCTQFLWNSTWASSCLLSHSSSYGTFIGWYLYSLWALSIYKHILSLQRCCFSCWNWLIPGCLQGWFIENTCAWWFILFVCYMIIWSQLRPPVEDSVSWRTHENIVYCDDK